MALSTYIHGLKYFVFQQSKWKEESDVFLVQIQIYKYKIKIKNIIDSKCWWRCRERKNPEFTVGGIWNAVSIIDISAEKYQKKVYLLYCPALPDLAIFPKLTSSPKIVFIVLKVACEFTREREQSENSPTLNSLALERQQHWSNKFSPMI